MSAPDFQLDPRLVRRRAGRAAAEVEDAAGFDADVVEALAHAPGDFPGKGVDGGVTGSGPLGPTPHEAWVELEVRQGHRGNARLKRT